MEWVKDVLKPEVIAVIIGVIGTCEATKKAGVRLPTWLVSLAVSILAGVALAEPLAWQVVIVMTLIVYGFATLAYEVVVKWFKRKLKGQLERDGR